jgi:hypothetical protein
MKRKRAAVLARAVGGICRSLLAVLCLVAPAGWGEPHAKGGVMEDQPFQLILSATFEPSRRDALPERPSSIPVPGLRAVLRNRSPKKQTVLLFPYRFPSLLTLTDSSGHPVRGDNPRVREKPLRSAWMVRREYYHSLSPGGEIEIAREEFYSRPIVKGAWELAWDGFQFYPMTPGMYRARLIWECEYDFWQNEKTGKRGQMPGVWKGRVESDEVSVRLPPPPG